MNHAVLLISCADNKGINAAVTAFIFEHAGNIVHADQHIDEQSNTFFMRIEWDLQGFSLSREQIADAFQPIAEKYSMLWELCFSDINLKTAIFVSKHLHCLRDILMRHRAGQLLCDIPLIISNHPDAKSVAEDHGIAFYEFYIDSENKQEQEKKQFDVLRSHDIDLVVLARYHQILTSDFVDHYVSRIINIHHSFLPAFVGSNPYLQAHQKGVKIIGVTSHYITAQLDQGPIIEQDTVRISHRNSLGDFVRKGQDLERVVLSRAVRWHLERKILSYGNKTVIFD